MLSGLVLMEVNPDNGDIIKVLDDGVDSDELNDLLDWDTSSEIVQSINKSDGEGIISLYYFGDEETDGAMKTGATTVTLDGESYNFLFNKTGGAESKGRGLTGVDDNKYIYSYGCRIKAGSDDKYQVVAVTALAGSSDAHSKSVVVDKVSSATLKQIASNYYYTNSKEEQVNFVNHSLMLEYLGWETSAGEISYEDLGTKLYLVNTSGNIQKSKVAAKDGDEWYFYVKDREVQLYTNNKDLKNESIKDWEVLSKLEIADN